MLRLAEGVTAASVFCLFIVIKFQLRITPTAKRNSYRVAWLVGVATQGSVLRPQPWAGKSQLRQSCCCLRTLCILPTIYRDYEGEIINTKSRGGGWRLRLGVYGGADLRKTSFPPCRLHHPHRHAVHDAIRRDGKKSGLRPFKKSGFRRYKNSCPCNPDYHAGHNTYGLISFFPARAGLFLPP